MPTRYSYDSLVVFRTSTGEFGWIINPSPVHHREGFTQDETQSTTSFPEGVTEVPESAFSIEYGHVSGGCAGDRQWDHETPHPEGWEEWQDERRSFLQECKKAVRIGKMPLDPEGLLRPPTRAVLDNASGGKKVSLERQQILKADILVHRLSDLPPDVGELFVNHTEAMGGSTREQFERELRAWRRLNPSAVVFVYNPGSFITDGRFGLFDAGFNLDRLGPESYLPGMLIKFRNSPRMSQRWPQPFADIRREEGQDLLDDAEQLEKRAAALRSRAAKILAEPTCGECGCCEQCCPWLMNLD